MSMSGHEKIYPSENNPCPAHRLIHYWIPWERRAEMSFSLENLWSIYELEEQQRHWGRLGGNTSCAVHTTPYEPTNVQASRAAPQRLSAQAPAPPAKMSNAVAFDRAFPSLPPSVLYDKFKTKWQSQQVFKALSKNTHFTEVRTQWTRKCECIPRA